MHALRQWSTRYFESLEGVKNPRMAHQLQNIMRDAGFVEVEQRTIPLPMCAWSEGQNRGRARVRIYTLLTER